MMNDNRTIHELQTGLDKGDFSSVELTTEYLKRIKADKFNTFITVNEKAIDEARLADKRIKAGQASELTGIPIAIKDVFTTKGLRTTAGSAMLDDYIPPYSASCVHILESYGMINIGKTNCDEFAMGSSNENSHYGPVKNPHDSHRVPGGSSGGSAVAVAADLAPVALGTDTGGSVRLPASFCGVIGFKPTYGRISRYGLIAMASSLDHVGIFGKEVADIASILQVIAGHDSHDATTPARPVPDYRSEIHKEMPKLKIGLPKQYFVDGIAEGVRTCIDERIAHYAKMPNLDFVEIDLPHTEYSLAAYYLIASSEISTNLARYDGLRYGHQATVKGDLVKVYTHSRSDALGTEVRRRIMLGTYALSAGYYEAYYLQASKVRTLIKLDFDAAFKKVDLILTPTSPTTAFNIGEKSTDPLAMYLADIFTVAANMAGLPAISIPIGMSQDLPVGLQLMGNAWSESQVLQVADYLMKQ